MCIDTFYLGPWTHRERSGMCHSNSFEFHCILTTGTFAQRVASAIHVQAVQSGEGK